MSNGGLALVDQKQKNWAASLEVGANSGAVLRPEHISSVLADSSSNGGGSSSNPVQHFKSSRSETDFAERELTVPQLKAHIRFLQEQHERLVAKLHEHIGNLELKCGKLQTKLGEKVSFGTTTAHDNEEGALAESEATAARLQRQLEKCAKIIAKLESAKVGAEAKISQLESEKCEQSQDKLHKENQIVHLRKELEHKSAIISKLELEVQKLRLMQQPTSERQRAASLVAPRRFSGVSGSQSPRAETASAPRPGTIGSLYARSKPVVSVSVDEGSNSSPRSPPKMRCSILPPIDGGSGGRPGTVPGGRATGFRSAGSRSFSSRGFGDLTAPGASYTLEGVGIDKVDQGPRKSSPPRSFRSSFKSSSMNSKKDDKK